MYNKYDAMFVSVRYRRAVDQNNSQRSSRKPHPVLTKMFADFLT